jgi:hypothetical protein
MDGRRGKCRDGNGELTKRCPDRTSSQFTISDCGMKTVCTSVVILEDVEGMLEAVVEDLTMGMPV